MRPQDLPLSRFLLGLALATYAATSIAGFALRLPFGEALLAGPADTAILALLTVSLLAVKRLKPRLEQTLTAMAGCGAFLTVTAIPLVAVLDPDTRGIATNGMAALILGMVLLWSFAVTAHILRHALSSSFLMGLMLAIVFHVVSYEVLSMLFDFPAKPE